MKKTNKKGFTIVELVIVIAVIAILAAVLIPTFSGVVTRAKQSAALQAARNANTEYLATLDFTSESMDEQTYTVVAGEYAFSVVKGTFNSTILSSNVAAGKVLDVANDGTFTMKTDTAVTINTETKKATVGS